MAFSVSYTYSINDRYSGALGRIRRATDRFSRGMGTAQTATRRLSQNLLGMQNTLTTVAGAIGGAAALNKYVSFETQMNKLGAVSLTTDENLSKMRETAKTLGETTQFSASEAAAGMEQLKLAGLSVDKVLKAIPGTLQLAAAGSLSVAAAADIATGTLGAMGLSIKDLPHVNDVLAAAQSKAKFTITELSESMRPVATTAKNLGVNLELLTASLGVMANANERGSNAGTLLRNAFTEIAGASVKQKELYRRLGVDLSSFVDKTGKIKNLKGFVGALSDVNKTGKLTVERLQYLFGERGFRAMQILIGAGVKPLENLETALKNSGGAAKRMAEIQMRGLPGVIKTLKSVTEALTIALFEDTGMDKFLGRVGKKIIGLIKTLKNADPKLLKFVAYLGLAVVVGGPLIVAFAILAGSVSYLIGLVGILGPYVLGVGLAFLAWKKAKDPINRVIIQPTIKAIKYLNKLRKMLTFEFESFIFNPAASMKKFEKNFAGADTFMSDPLGKMSELSRGFASGLESLILNPIDFLKGGFEQAYGGTTDQGPSVSAQKASAMKGSLNGTIDIKAIGASVKSSLTSSLPGNIGFNMAPAGGIP